MGTRFKMRAVLDQFFKPRIALALGGGGARGFAHLGVLKVLEEEGIPVDLVVGSSMGAVVGALWVFCGSASEAERRLREFVESPHFRTDAFRRLSALAPGSSPEDGLRAGIRRAWSLALFFATNAFKSAYFDPERFASNIAGLLPEARIEDAPTRLAVVATDLGAGREIVLTQGPVRTAIQASSALAGVLPPLNWDGRELVDGGYTNLIPVETAFRLGADAVVAVDVSNDASDTKEFGRTGNAIQYRSAAILAETQKRLLLRFADAVVHPEMAGTHWADFEALDRIAPLGEAAARAALPAIRAALGKGRRERILGHLRRRRWSVDLRRDEG
jgi:NTE family protein